MDSLDALDNALDNLEEVLAPLLDKSLSETLDKLELLQKAKLQVLLPYVVNDLVFIYLKTRGINPKTHPVVEELDRIKQYFQKIKNAEDPEKRRFAVDQGAATRFIKHAIKESQAIQEQAQRGMKQGTHTRFTDTSAVGGPSQNVVVVPKATEAALMKIKAREIALQEEDASSEESELEVFAEPELSTPVEEQSEMGNGKGKGKEVLETSRGSKRRRGIDPWTGYDEKSSGAPPTQYKRVKNRLPMSVASTTPQPEVIDQQKNHLGAQKTTATGISENSKDQAVEVIDVDSLTLTQTIPDAQDLPKLVPEQVIDVDATDSSQSAKKARKRKRKKKLNP